MSSTRVAVAVGVAIVASIVATTVLTSHCDTRPRVAKRTVEPAAPGVGAGAGADAPNAPDAASSLAPAQRSPIDAPAPAPSNPLFEDGRLVTFDLRGPDDEPLDAGSILIESDRGRSVPRHITGGRLVWRRASPTFPLPAWIRWLHAEADSGASDLACRDLVSDSIEIDPDAALPADAAFVIRLGRRPGIFGRIHGLHADSATSIVWIESSALDGTARLSDEIARRGHSTMPTSRSDADATYEMFGLEPGAFLVGLRDELGDVLEPLTPVDVADRMVRVDLTAHYDEESSLLVHLVGLSEEDVARAEFVWIDAATPHGGWTPLQRVVADATSFRVRPIGASARDTMRSLLAGTLARDEHCVLAFVRQGEVAAAQPLANCQREATFTLGSDANLAVRVNLDGEPSARRRLDLVPAAALALLSRPPAEQEDGAVDGTTKTQTFRHLAPGDFVLQVWAPLVSSLHHGEVWWPIERRALTLHAGDQELALEPTSLHPLTVRFDRARFGVDVRVQLMLHGFEKWPRYAASDERGVARFDDVPAGDYTVAVIGDAAGQVDCTVPETSELTVEPTRRER